MGFFEALLGLGGTIFNAFSQSSSNKENAQVQQQINAQNLAWAREQQGFQYNTAKEFAQHGLQWKIDDAAARGIHPLVALGAQGATPPSISVGGEARAWENKSPDFSSLGQDLSRAAKALASQEEREAVDVEAARKLSLEKASLENDILRQELGSKVLRNSTAGGQLGPPLEKSQIVGRVPVPRPGPYRTDGFAHSEDEIKSKETSHPGVRRTPLWGVIPIESYPHRASGQDLENEYGEVGGSALAAGNIVPDLVYTYGGYPLNAARNAWRWYKRYQTGSPEGRW